MSVVISAPSRASAEDVINPRANNAREQIFAGQVFDWASRGWVFSAGLLVDDTTNIATVTTLADTTPTIVLQSPAGADLIIVPLRVTVAVVDDGGGLTTLDLVYTKAARACATVLAFSAGTTMTGVINRFTTNPLVTPRATIQYTVTASALTVVDSIVIAHKELPDAALTAATWGYPEFDYKFTEPLGLTEGAALLLYGVTATGAGEIRPCITWAEIPATIYKP